MHKQINYQDRVTIEIQLKRLAKNYEIAKIIWKDDTTIWREIKRNSVKKKWSNKTEYLSEEAEIKAYQRRWRKELQSMKIDMNSEMQKFIIEQIQRTDIIPSPKVISKLWNEKQKENKTKISHTSIYKWLETWMWNQYKKYLAFKHKWYSKKKEKANNVKIKDRIAIEQRPEIINNREEKGHFEADLIVSKKWFKWALLTLTDRKTRLSRIFKLKDKSSEYIMNLIASIKDEVWIKSVTFDNWMEFAFHHILKNIWIETYFCNPYSSWEKWSVENLNRIIRRFFPKWTIFDEISEEKIKSICSVIANTPREILWFLSPNQIHFHNS